MTTQWTVLSKHFALGDDGNSHPTTETIEPDELVLDAACCPVEAITVTDAATGDLLAPEE